MSDINPTLTQRGEQREQEQREQNSDSPLSPSDIITSSTLSLPVISSSSSTPSSSASQPKLYQKILAWLVHLYTSLGLVLALCSVFALFDHNASLFFVLNFTAVMIDASDGFLARSLRVKEVTPYFNGTKLDDLIDYITFTFLPVISLPLLDLLPREYVLWLSVPLIASSYGFCQQRAKTDHSFVGFPSYWNIVAIYLFVFTPPLWAVLSIILFLSFMTFIPIHYVYPTRTALLFKTTMIGGAVFMLALFYIAITPKSAHIIWVAYGSLVYVVYYTILSFIHHIRVHRV